MIRGTAVDVYVDAVIQALQKRPPRTKLLSSDLANLAGVNRGQLALRMQEAENEGRVHCDRLSPHKLLWSLPVEYDKRLIVRARDLRLDGVDIELDLGERPKKVYRPRPRDTTALPEPIVTAPVPPPPLSQLPDEVYAKMQKIVVEEAQRPRAVAPVTHAWKAPAEQYVSARHSLDTAQLQVYELRRVVLFDLVNTGNPVVVGDPHMELAELMLVARELYKSKAAPFQGAAVDLHIALELKKVIQAIKEAKDSLGEALATMLELAA